MLKYPRISLVAELEGMFWGSFLEQNLICYFLFKGVEHFYKAIYNLKKKKIEY